MTTRSSLIYIVDDEPAVTESLQRLISLETPHRVKTFQRAIDALESMKADPPDLVISDLKMPAFDGIALLRQTRKVSPDAARIILTGYADKESLIRAVNTAGIYQFVEKPWDNASLLVLINNALEHVVLTRQVRETLAALQTRNEQLERAIAELRDAQDRLVAAERLAAVGRLASGVAHEIGNQLALLGYAELIAERHTGDPQTQELVEPLLAARRRMGVMISAIKDFVRGGSAASYTREPQPIAEIVDEAVSILRFERLMKTRTLVREPDDRAATASVNGDRILQVLLNLIRNALQATADEGKVRVGVEQRGGDVLIEVADDGHGIAPDDLPKIWEPFFSTKGEKGTGLGLGICKRIVEEHGGAITVESRPKEGARFTIRLPAAQRSTIGQSG